MVRNALVLGTVAAALMGCKPPIPTEVAPPSHRFGRTETLGDVSAMALGTGGHLWVALDQNFALREGPDEGFDFVDRGDLPDGRVTFLGTIDGSREWLFAHVHGHGFFRNWANSDDWDPVTGLQSPLLEVLRPGLRPLPTGMTTTDDGITWLTTVGGLYFTSDEGVTWDRADTSSSGDVNIVFTGVDAHESRVVSVAYLPVGLIPEQFSGVLGGRVFLSDNSGLTWTTPDEAFPSNNPTSAAVADDGTIYVGTMDNGVVRGTGDGVWTPLFGPSDVTSVEWVDNGLSVASATRGLWRLDDELWTSVGEGPAVGVTGGMGILRNGEVYEVEEGVGEPPPDPENGTVYIALSFFGNFYHSTRGDSPNEGGFGQDIRVTTAALDWLDAHPDVRADWVFENARTTDDLMPTHSPELLARIRGRVQSGIDDVRLMGHTAGATASMSRAEFDRSLDLAKDSTDTAIGPYVAGAHPMDSMLSPDNIGWYADANVDWISLYYGANGFTGPRNQIVLNGAAAHNPFLLTDPVSQRTIQTVPVYHHGDLLDHGGLAGWAKQLNVNHSEDTLIALHFDADAESWENFDRELEALEALPFVQFTTIHDYVSAHAGGPDLVLSGDVANGVGDGFSSWSEKTINHEVWTQIEVSRRYAEAAAHLAVGGADSIASELVEATDARLDALAVNNFGLTGPNLHPERVTAALAFAQTAEDEARQAYDLAVSGSPPLEVQQLQVVHPGTEGGPVTIPFRLRMPAGSWEGEGGLAIERGNSLLPIRASFVESVAGSDAIDVEVDLVVAPESFTLLDWSYDPGDERHIRGSLSPADIPSLFLLQPPFVECASGRRIATGGTIGTTVGDWGLKNSRIEEWQLPSCTGPNTSTIRRVLSKRHERAGVVVEVSGTIDQAADAGGILSMVLAPITCPSGIESLAYRSYGGTLRTRNVGDNVEAWNPVSADGWVAATCGDGSTVQMAIDQTVASSMGMLSLRNTADEAVLAPLGTLWGDPPYHDGPRTGGTGMADLVTPLIGSQFQPSAPEWAGKEVSARIWVTSNTAPELLDLFANPPLVRGPLD